MDFTLDPQGFKPLHSASGCIIRSGNKVLFLQRESKKYNETVWSIPAGKIEEGETPQQALKREIKEETGIDLTTFSQLATYNIRLHKKKYDFKYHLFHSQVPKDIQILISKEHKAYKWVTLSEINKLTLESGAEIYTKVIKQLQTQKLHQMKHNKSRPNQSFEKT